MSVPFTFYIDYPESHDLHQKISKILMDAEQLIESSITEADFVIRPVGFPSWVEPERLILVGDFSRQQNVPAGAVLVDFKTGMVQMPGNSPNIYWKHYLDEHLTSVWSF